MDRGGEGGAITRARRRRDAMEKGSGAVEAGATKRRLGGEVAKLLVATMSRRIADIAEADEQESMEIIPTGATSDRANTEVANDVDVISVKETQVCKPIS